MGDDAGAGGAVHSRGEVSRLSGSLSPQLGMLSDFNAYAYRRTTVLRIAFSLRSSLWFPKGIHPPMALRNLSTTAPAVARPSARMESADCLTSRQDSPAAADKALRLPAAARCLDLRRLSCACASLRSSRTRARASASILRSALRKPR